MSIFLEIITNFDTPRGTIMNKSILFLLCVSTLSQAMDTAPIKKQSDKVNPRYLFGGSTRDNSNKQLGFPTKQLWAEDKADLSHTTTCLGKAVTIDVKESALPGAKHIVGDLRRHEFKKNSVKFASLERLPTFGLSKIEKGPIVAELDQNYLGDCIQNVGKGMRKKAIIEVEWHPFIAFSQGNLDQIETILDPHMSEKNPFTGSINKNLACLSFDIAQDLPAQPGFEESLPKKFLECACTLSATLKKLFTFYEEKNVGPKDLLHKRINEELFVLHEMINNNAMAALSHGPSDSLEEFSSATKSFYMIPDTAPVYEKMAIALSGVKIYNATIFMSETLFYHMLCDATVIHNKQRVIEFMNKSGFKNVSLERTTSKRNGRENVWIIEGTKA